MEMQREGIKMKREQERGKKHKKITKIKEMGKEKKTLKEAK